MSSCQPLFPAYAEEPQPTGPFQMELFLTGFQEYVSALHGIGALSKISVRIMLSELHYIVSHGRLNHSEPIDSALIGEIRGLDSQLNSIQDNLNISNVLWLKLKELLERIFGFHFRFLTPVNQNLRAHALCTIVRVPEYYRRPWNIHRPISARFRNGSTYIIYYEQYAEYDPFFTQPECPNPWLTDNTELWENESLPKEASVRRVRRWAFSLQEVLADPLGRLHFTRFLEKEFSSENLKFWEAVQYMKSLPLSKVQSCADEIWSEYLAPDASCPINVDSQSHELSRKNMSTPDRWTFDIAAVKDVPKIVIIFTASFLAHVYHLMKSDSYPRYIRSEMYKEFLNGSKKKVKKIQ